MKQHRRTSAPQQEVSAPAMNRNPGTGAVLSFTEATLLAEMETRQPVRCFAVANGRVWTGLKDGGLCKREISEGSVEDVALAATGEPYRRPGGFVTALLYVREAGEVWAGYGDGMVVVFAESGMQAVFEAKHHSGAIHAVCATPAEDFCFTAGDDWVIRKWSADPGKKTVVASLSGHSSSVHCLSYASGVGLMSGAGDGSLHHWIRGSTSPVVLKAHAGACLSMLVKRDVGGPPLDTVEEELWTGGTDGVCVWKLAGGGGGGGGGGKSGLLMSPGSEGGESGFTLLIRACGAQYHTGPVSSLVAVPFSDTVLSFDKQGVVMLWSGHNVLQRISPTGNWQRHGVLSAAAVARVASCRLWSCGADGRIKVWSAPLVEEPQETASLRRTAENLQRALSKTTRNVQTHAKAAADAEQTVRAQRAQIQALQKAHPPGPPANHQSGDESAVRCAMRDASINHAEQLARMQSVEADLRRELAGKDATVDELQRKVAAVSRCMSTGVDNCEKDALQHQLQAQIRARELGDERYAEATAEIERLTRLLEETRNCAAADAGYVSPHKRLDFSNTSIVASPADTLCVAGRLLVSPPINSLALTSVPDPIQHQRIPVAQPVTQSQAFVLEAVEKYRNEVQKLGSAVKDNRAARESRQSAVHEHGAAILQAQLANAKEEAAAHQKQAHNLAAANDALTGHVAALRAEIDRTNAESAARAGEQNEHIRQLQEEIARLEATRGDASARLAEAEQARRDLERLFADRDAESSTLARKLREVEAEAERADERHTVREREAEHTVSSLRREVTDLRIELDRNASALVHETAASRELSERYASAASRSSSLSVHNEEQARRVGLLEDELAESQDKLQAAAAECAAARAQLHEYQSMLDREQGECAAAVTQRDGLQWHNEALENEVASLKAQLAVAQNESGANAALRASNEDLAMAIDSEKRLLESSQREADSLRTRLAVREAEAAERDARDAQLQAEAARLRDGVAQGDADKRAALDRLTLQQQEAEALRHALREQTALAHHAQIELAAVKARKEAAESELRQVKDEMVRKEVHWKRVVADPSDPAKDRLSASLAADLAQANAEKKELINCVERLQRLVDTMQARAAGGADFSSYPSAPRSGFMSTQSVGAESVAGEQSADRPLYDRRGMHHHDLVRQPAVTASLPGTEGRYREYSSSSLAMRDHSERKIVLDPRAHAAYHQPEEMLKRRCSESLAFEEPSAAAAFPPAPLLANRISAAAASSPWIVKQLHNLQQSLGGASHSQEDLQAKTAYLVDLLTLSVG